jgi:two-component system, NarL family, sensor histidine kinase UhpB
MIPPQNLSGTSTAKCQTAMPTIAQTRTLMGSELRRIPSRFPWALIPIVGSALVRQALVVSLFWRVVAINAGGLVVAALVLALSPATVSPRLQVAEAIVLAVGTLLVIAVNVVLLRRVFGPLERLTELMRRVDPMAPGRRIELERPVAEVAELYHSFNAMLDRLEHERRTSGRRALMAQESERQRLARELHDEVGQTLTGVVLQLEGLHRAAPGEMAEPVALLQETAREGVEEVREIVRGLRPQALDEFGLRSALISLAAGVTERTGVRVQARLAQELPPLAREQDLAIYRVAQESLTNVARHAEAATAEVILGWAGDRVVLRVRDDGRGIADSEAASHGVGLGGMRERALLIGGRLIVGRHEAGGTEVRLEVPLRETP